LLSYSAYLWHWPLLAFYRYGHEHISFLAGVVFLLLTFALAWLSYRYIEQPARRSQAPWPSVYARHYLVPAAVLSALAILAVRFDGYGVRHLSAYKESLASARTE